MNKMKAMTKSMLAAALVSAALALGAQTPAPAAATPAAPAAPAAKTEAEKPVTLDEFLAPLPDTVAELKGDKLSKNDLKLLMIDARIPVDQIAKMPNSKVILRSIVERAMIQRMLLKKAAAAGFTGTEEWAARNLKEIWGTLPKEQQDMILKQISSKYKDIDAYIADQVKNRTQRESMAIGKYMESLVKANLAKISDADVQKFYDERKETDFKTPETVLISHILAMAPGRDMKTGKELTADEKKKQDEAARKKIAEVQAKIAKGGDFGALAKEYSDCPSGKQSNGDLGAVRRGQMVPEFEKAAFALEKPGQVSDIVKTQFGYHIIKLKEKKPASYIALDDKVKKNVKEYLASQMADNAFRAELEQIQKNDELKVFGLPAPAPAPAPAPTPAPAAK